MKSKRSISQVKRVLHEQCITSAFFRLFRCFAFSFALFVFFIPRLYAQDPRSDSLTVTDLEKLGVHFTEGNSVTLLPSGAQKFDDLFRAIRAARRYIYIEYFNLRNDSIGNLLFVALEEKAFEGLSIRIIYDDYGNFSNDRPLRARHLRALARRNIQVVQFDKIRFPYLNHIFHRDHRKIVVIDDRIVYTGGMNVADYYITGRPEIGQWRDMHMCISGPCVVDYRNIFCQMWKRCSSQEIDSLEYIVSPVENTLDFAADSLLSPPITPDSGVLIGVANREPKRSPQVVRRGYIHAIDNAQKSIQIVNPYFSLVPSVRRSLYRALSRGVRLQIMLSTRCDVPVMPDVNAYHAKRLMRRGAEIYYYEDGFIHSKFMTVDSSFCTLGSTNLNSRSLKYDYEVNAFIVDSATTNALQTIFNNDILHSTLLTPETYRQRRSFCQRLRGWFYHLLIPLI